jgi:hypothetical protein
LIQVNLLYETPAKLTAAALIASVLATGNLCASQPSIPPASGRTLVIPFFCNNSATRALLASLGHEQ